ncbi:MAG: hypothetical protein M3145_10135 [Pseudomonadota bacterium]|nr:hypothetical protein [Pseudomonadota bacterium]
MPHYYFDCTDGQRFVLDDEGIDLSDSDAAHALARALAKGLMEASRPSIRDWSGWAVDVTDEAGESVMSVPFLSSGR